MVKGLKKMAKKGLIGGMSFAKDAGAINWFPGHMAAATRAIRNRLKLCDLVIDARKWTRHFESRQQDCIAINAHSRSSVKKLLDLAELKLKEVIAREPTLLVMVSPMLENLHRLIRFIKSQQLDFLREPSMHHLPFKKTSPEWADYVQLLPHFAPLKRVSIHRSERFALVLTEFYFNFLKRRQESKPPPFDDKTLGEMCSTFATLGFDISAFDNWWQDAWKDYSKQGKKLEEDVLKALEKHNNTRGVIESTEASLSTLKLRNQQHKSKFSELTKISGKLFSEG